MEWRVSWLSFVPWNPIIGFLFTTCTVFLLFLSFFHETFSAHLIAHAQMYGPKGQGALYIRRKPRVKIEPLFSGGGQER